MDSIVTRNVARSKDWLSNQVFPLWFEKGIHAGDGGFVEALSLRGEILDLPRRAMVQARQIYAFRTGMDMGCFPEARTRAVVARAAAFLIERYSAPSGAFFHSIPSASKPGNEQPDLYTQAFALFGLANAYAAAPEASIKRRALALVDYLRRERRAPGGGYTELEDGRFVLRSNPHMHLFEAAIAWLRADEDPRWKELAAEILDLCLTKFVDPETGALCERFAGDWTPERTDGRFVFEPGHHYEWSWLITLHAESRGLDATQVPLRLYRIAEARGVSPGGDAYDEVWSDGVPKKKSSRFWPQGERTKSAARLGAHAPDGEKPGFARSADMALESLSRYLQTPEPGLWRDTLLENGQFREEPVKASSLYHIINAIEEYAALRPGLTSSR
jgi:mannose-6-phosphate isomerase